MRGDCGFHIGTEKAAPDRSGRFRIIFGDPLAASTERIAPEIAANIMSCHRSATA
jgi:hypothetical protein